MKPRLTASLGTLVSPVPDLSHQLARAGADLHLATKHAGCRLDMFQKSLGLPGFNRLGSAKPRLVSLKHACNGLDLWGCLGGSSAALPGGDGKQSGHF